MKNLIFTLAFLLLNVTLYAQSNLVSVLKRFNGKVVYPNKQYPCVLKATFEADGAITISIDASYNKAQSYEYQSLEKKIKEFFNGKYTKVNEYLYRNDASYRAMTLMYFDGMFYFTNTSDAERFCVSPELVEEHAYKKGYKGEKYEQINEIYKKLYFPLITGAADNTGTISPNSLRGRKIKDFFIKLAKKDNEKAFVAIDDKEKEFYTVNIRDEDEVGTIPLDEFITKEISTSEQTAKSGKRVYSVYPLGHPKLAKKYTIDVYTENFPTSVSYKGRNGKDAMKPTYSGNSVTNLINQQTGKSVNGGYGYIGDNGSKADNITVKVALFTNPVDKKQCLQVNISERDFFLVPLDRTFTIDASGGNGGNGSDGLKGLEEGEYTRGLKKIKTKGSDKNGDGGNGGNAGSGADVTLLYDPSVEPYLKNIVINTNAGEIGQGGNSPATFAGVATGIAGQKGYKGSKGTITKTPTSIKASKITINLDTFTVQGEEKTANLMVEQKKYVGIDASTLGGAATAGGAGAATGGKSTTGGAASALQTTPLLVAKDFTKLPYEAVATEDGKVAIFAGNFRDSHQYSVYDAKTKQFGKINILSGKPKSIYKSPSGKWTLCHRAEKQGDFYISNDIQKMSVSNDIYAISLFGYNGSFFEMSEKNATNASTVAFADAKTDNGDNIKLNFLKKDGAKYSLDGDNFWMTDANGNVFGDKKYTIELNDVKYWKENYFVISAKLTDYTTNKLTGQAIYIVKVDKNTKSKFQVINGTEVLDRDMLDNYSLKDGYRELVLNNNNTASLIYTKPNFGEWEYQNKNAAFYTFSLSTTASAIVKNPTSVTLEHEDYALSRFQPYKDGFICVAYDGGERIKLIIINAKGKTTSSIIIATGISGPSYYNFSLTNIVDGKAFVVINYRNDNLQDYKASIIEISGLK